MHSAAGIDGSLPKRSKMYGTWHYSFDLVDSIKMIGFVLATTAHAYNNLHFLVCLVWSLLYTILFSGFGADVRLSARNKQPVNGKMTTAASYAMTESSSQRQEKPSKNDPMRSNRSFVPRLEMILHGSPLFRRFKKTGSAADRGWTVRPRYSAGVSSRSGSMGKVDEEDEETKLDATKYSHVNRDHTSTLDLNNLRIEMQQKGDITSTVVRIEVSVVLICIRSR